MMRRALVSFTPALALVLAACQDVTRIAGPEATSESSRVVGHAQTTYALDPGATITFVVPTSGAPVTVLDSESLRGVNAAIVGGGEPSKIADADQSLIDGDALRESGNYKDAVNKYKDALANAEGA